MYDWGTYARTYQAGEVNYTSQRFDGSSKAEGYLKSFMESYDVLENMSSMTNITDSGENTFLFLSNETTHDPAILKAPDYTPEDRVDNSTYDEANADRFTDGNRTLDVSNPYRMGAYHVNMSAILRLGEWLDFLKSSGVYDNTRIIIAADHGYSMGHSDDLKLDDSGDDHKDMYYYYPLLLVKDFNSTGFSVSEEFMTNADVPALALNGVVENPENPFTGKEINFSEKTAHDQYVSLSDEYLTSENDGNCFLPSKWASISENLFDKSAWQILESETVLKEHSFN
jgi:membrane-anchored protein YejM (alkaline phosphatase superfamily)